MNERTKKLPKKNMNDQNRKLTNEVKMNKRMNKKSKSSVESIIYSNLATILKYFKKIKGSKASLRLTRLKIE